AAARAPPATRQNVLGFRHLVVETNNRHAHLLRDRAGNDHQVCLPRAGAHDFHTKARQVVARSRRSDHFNRAACQAEEHRPHRVFAAPVIDLAQTGNRNVSLQVRRNRKFRALQFTQVQVSHQELTSSYQSRRISLRMLSFANSGSSTKFGKSMIHRYSCSSPTESTLTVGYFSMSAWTISKEESQYRWLKAESASVMRVF